MHLVFGLLIFTVVALATYMMMASYTELSETVVVILALGFAFVAEYTYMKLRADS
ncbi:hypothetical protein HNR44_000409 [Geomicrobium halophilum]|uniref:Uncharacterized protein n=1 Tax=Geomicrobium halophilum TaxID=549000 RepID=A0A841PI46_9BACL|nr:hypothetical protein [Geomicrobium halophilum]MBB6448460.1 hypothetical protein [Geomicrobium halophilum]